MPLSPGEGVARPHFQLRVRPADAGTDTDRSGYSEFELFLIDLEDDGPDARWVSRRRASVALPLAELIVTSPRLGVPVLAPEAQLLYKAKYHRPKDEHDFARAAAALACPA